MRVKSFPFTCEEEERVLHRSTRKFGDVYKPVQSLHYLVLGTGTLESWIEISISIIKHFFKLHLVIMLPSLLVLTAALATASQVLGDACSTGGNAANPIVNLGSAGSYMGIVQNDGT